MNEKIKRQMAEYFLANEEISSENVEIYLYGIELLIKKVCHIIFILFLGLVSGQLYGTILFLVIYAQIREYSGGYHADSSKGCYCCTIAVTICAIALLRVLPQIAPFWSLGGLLVGGGIIWRFSPQESKNKPLLEAEKDKYRCITRKYLLVSSGICAFGVVNPLIIYSVVTAWIIQAIMLVAGSLKNTCSHRKRI